MYETIETGKPQTSYLKFGDTVRVEMLDQTGHSLFGAIEQQVKRYGVKNAFAVESPFE